MNNSSTGGQVEEFENNTVENKRNQLLILANKKESKSQSDKELSQESNTSTHNKPSTVCCKHSFCKKEEEPASTLPVSESVGTFSHVLSKFNNSSSSENTSSEQPPRNIRRTLRNIFQNKLEPKVNHLERKTLVKESADELSLNLKQKVLEKNNNRCSNRKIASGLEPIQEKSEKSSQMNVELTRTTSNSR